jgi:hypothetical protein
MIGKYCFVDGQGATFQSGREGQREHKGLIKTKKKKLLEQNTIIYGLFIQLIALLGALRQSNIKQNEI